MFPAKGVGRLKHLFSSSASTTYSRDEHGVGEREVRVRSLCCLWGTLHKAPIIRELVSQPPIMMALLQPRFTPQNACKAVSITL